MHHSLLAFTPRLEGLFSATERFGLFGTPFYAFVNGAAAVIVFFVLSGFVLTYRSIEAQSTSGIGMSVLKRWPRLAGPVVIVSFISGLFVWSRVYSNTAAAEISRSSWLKAWFANSPYEAPPPLAALYEGLFGTFLYGQAHFNSNLSTMYYEFFGSFIALALALIVIELRRPRLGLILSTGLFVLTLITCRFFAPIVAGVVAAQIYSLLGFPRVRLGTWSALAAGTAIFLLFGFKENPVAYGFYSGLNRVSFIPMPQLGVLFHTIAALLIISLTMRCEPLKRLLSDGWYFGLGRCRSQSISPIWS